MAVTIYSAQLVKGILYTLHPFVQTFKMKLLGLPAELLHAILREAVLVRGLKRAMRLRLVNSKLFMSFSKNDSYANTEAEKERLSQDVLQAVFETRLLDTANGYRTRQQPIWHSYISYRVWAENDNATSLFTAIRRAAENLCQSSGASDESTLRAHIDGLSCLANHVLYHGLMRDRGIVATSHSTFEVYIPEGFDNATTWTKHLLVAAAYRNDKATVLRLLQDEGCDPSEESDIFGSATRAAALQGNNDILVYLLEGTRAIWSLGSNQFSEVRCAAIRGATQGGHLHTLSLILEVGNTRWGPFAPFSEQYTKALKYGLKTRSPCVYDHIVQLIRAEGHGYPESYLPGSLAQAAGFGNLEMVHHLLKKGALVNGDMMNPPANPLRSAALKGHTEIVKLLLAHGARPRLGWGDTLTSAAKSGYLDVVKVLLDYGADVNERPAEDLRAPPAIISAIQLEHEKMFYFLRKKGAILRKPETGGLALDIAIKQGLESMVKILLQEGVEINDTHVEIATKHGKEEIVRILRHHIAMPRKDSYAQWALKMVYKALSKTIYDRLTVNARRERTHATRKHAHSALHTSSSPPLALA